ncbi:MAG: cupredoxin domain-containing protein [Gammaproteobacteria bacterium]|nr:cupredoxin domain-containing protein [Gammaproteobacteria bacterium]
MITVILFNAIAAILALLVIWWFWLVRTKTVSIENDRVTIYVENGVYSPNRIKLPAGEALTIEFVRKDASPCSEYVVFEGLDVHQQLPLNKRHRIELGELPAGEYRFTCQMGMYQGELIVE